MRNVTSPDDALSALLVQRRGHNALSSDVYYVILADNHHGMPDLPKAVHEKPILVARNAQHLVLTWTTPIAIDLICRDCGIKKTDLIERNKKWNDVNVTYVGLPEGTKYRDYSH